MAMRVRLTVFQNGERYRLLVDAQSGLPIYYPNLFVTSQIRNRSQSVSAMETALGSIKHFLAYCDEDKLEHRIRDRQYFTIEELDAIRDHCQLTADGVGSPAPTRAKRGLSLAGRARRRVGKSCQYSRLTTAANYFEWLVAKIHGAGLTPDDRTAAVRVGDGLRKRRPRYRSLNQLDSGEKALSEDEADLLEKVIDPLHPLNPFRDPGVAERNYLIVKLAAELGLRSGELLSIKIRDIDFNQCRLTVHRRADDRDDSRVNEPNAKTLGRSLPLGPKLIQCISMYVTNLRWKIPNAKRNEFLFVTHKAGPTQGQPISKETLKQVFKRLASVDPTLKGLHPHALRHTWNDTFSKKVDQLPAGVRPTAAEEAQMRNHLMGWKPGSGTAGTYNERHVRRKADAASLALQEKMYAKQEK